MFSAFPLQTVVTLAPSFHASEVLNYPQLDGALPCSQLHGSNQRNGSLTLQVSKDKSKVDAWRTRFGMEGAPLRRLDSVPSSIIASLQVTSQPDTSTHIPLLLPGFPWAVSIQHFWNSVPWNQETHWQVLGLQSAFCTTHQGFMAIKSFSVHRSIYINTAIFCL